MLTDARKININCKNKQLLKLSTNIQILRNINW